MFWGFFANNVNFIKDYHKTQYLSKQLNFTKQILENKMYIKYQKTQHFRKQNNLSQKGFTLQTGQHDTSCVPSCCVQKYCSIF